MHDRGGGACLRVLSESNRVDARSLSKKLADLSEASEEARAAVGLVDVRPKAEFDFASLPGFVNLPFDELEDFGRSWGDGAGGETLLRGKREVYVVCRRGNDSQLAVELRVLRIRGGMNLGSRPGMECLPLRAHTQQSTNIYH